jgi:carbamoyl-phosphate synthase small subunit
LIKKAKKISSKKFTQLPTGVLVLENKVVFKGIGIGYQGSATGEICFNTSFTGYQEIISDPSYAGQIINFTFPHIGNVGINKEDNESDKIWTKGVIFNTEITNPSNYRSLKKLDTWLKKNKIVGITGLDTRSLTNFIRDKGAPKGTISNNNKGNFNLKKLTNSSVKWPGLKGLDLAKTVTTKKKYIWKRIKTCKKEKVFEKNKKKIHKIIAIDYGIKKNILRYFSNFNCEVIVVPCNLEAKEIVKLKPDGIFLSNGPGDPAATGRYAINTIQKLMKANIPIFGICLGHQLLALALKAKTKKMKLGHRGANHPVKNLINNKVEITSQNHGFEIVKETLPKNIEVTHKSLFDNCIEGIKLKKRPIFSVQYHPESNPGPQDSHYLFNQFINEIKKNAKKKRY